MICFIAVLYCRMIVNKVNRDKSMTGEKVNIDSLLSCLHDSETGDPHLQVIAFAMSLHFICGA